MLVSLQNLEQVREDLDRAGNFSLDTETTGLFPYKGDSFFSIIIASEKRAYYFNFQPYPGLDKNYVLGEETISFLCELLDKYEQSTWFLHNAKFDMHMLATRDLKIAGKIHDTEVVSRLLKNTRTSGKLADCASEIGLRKDDKVEEYIKKHRLFSWITTPGKKKRAKKPHYDKVPFEIISRYGEIDGEITLKLGLWQIEQIEAQTKQIANFRSLYERECLVTKLLFEMERDGMRVDPDFCARGIGVEEQRISQAENDFYKITGLEFKDSRITLKRAFEKIDLKYPLTEKGNPCFKEDVLAKIDHPLTKTILSYREAYKNCNTYFRNFLELKDNDNFIHCTIRQSGTATGRLSCASPNLQNLPKENIGDFPVRGAVIPPDKDHLLLLIDYDQMEYRLMLDYAKEFSLIDKINNEGLDVHTATAKLCNVERKHAKTLNFLLIYGGGTGALAENLKISLGEAQTLKQKYFDACPNVASFMQKVSQKARTRGFVFNWAGRKYDFLDNFYKAPNYLIQGGCADIIKKAMLDVQTLLFKYRSKLIMQVHDELIISLHKSELELVPLIKELMERAYEHRYIPLTAGVSYSYSSWADKKEGFPRLEN